MTPDQIAEVEASFRRFVPIAEPAAKLFYATLFAMDPSLRPLFATTDLAAQGRKLMTAIGFVVGHLHRPEAMLPALRDLGHRHAGYGAEARHYETVGAALLATLAEGLGEHFTPATHDAWLAAYQLLAQEMIAAAEEDLAVRAA